MSKLYRVTESTYSRPRRVDREQGILYGCKLLGTKSRNGREYSQSALKEAAEHYKRLGIDLDHRRDPKQDRSLRDLIACRPRNVRVESDGIYGDVHLLMSDPNSAKLLEAADKDSALFGFSHEADLRGQRRGGVIHVESVPRVLSLDLVRHPATTRGAFESEANMATADTFIATEQEEAGQEMPDPRQLLATAMTLFEKAGDTEMAGKIHKLLKPSNKAAADDPGNDPEPEAPESDRTRGQGVTESVFKRLCESAGMTAPEGLYKSLRHDISLDEALETINGLKGVKEFQAPPRQPRSPGRGNGTAVPKTREELRKFLHSK